MRASFGSWIVSRLAGAVAGLWLCGAGAAWAGGGGGADLTTIQALLSDPNTGLCKMFGMSSCPKLPTATQAILQVAGLGNNLPEMVGAQNSIPPGSRVTAGNPAALPADIPVNSNTGLAILPLATTMPNTSEVLAPLTPLAFISQSSGTAVATQLYDPKADTFLYAVGVSTLVPGGVTGPGGLTDPDMAYFFYDDLSRTNQNLPNSIAKFTFPLTILNNGAETTVMTTLQVQNVCTGGTCSPQAQAVGGIGTPQSPVAASQLGISFALVFSTSPAAPTSKHAIFEWAIPLLVTGACQHPVPPGPGFCLQGQTPPGPDTDPAYFYSLLNPGKPNPVNTGVYTAFVFDDLGTELSPPSKFPSIGLAPTAAPFGAPPPAGGTSSFALCANLPGGNGNGQAPVPSVGAYYSVATSGEMFLSAPLPGFSSSVCSLQ